MWGLPASVGNKCPQVMGAMQALQEGSSGSEGPSASLLSCAAAFAAGELCWAAHVLLQTGGSAVLCVGCSRGMLFGLCLMQGVVWTRCSAAADAGRGCTVCFPMGRLSEVSAALGSAVLCAAAVQLHGCPHTGEA